MSDTIRLILLIIAISFLALAPFVNIKVARCTGACDVEDFKPDNYWYYRCREVTTTDCWYLNVEWTHKPSEFDNEHWFVVDFYRTESCDEGTDKDVYDFISGNTDLPPPIKIDVEEWDPNNIKCILIPRLCNEEVEIGTKTPANISTNTWYYLYSSFEVKIHSTSFGMRFELNLRILVVRILIGVY